MSNSQTAAAIIEAAKEARTNLSKLEQELQDEIEDIRFRAFREGGRELTGEERERRAALRARQTEVREAFVVLAYTTLRQLDESSEVALLQQRMNDINAGIGAHLNELAQIERYATTVAKITDEFAKIVEKAAQLAAGGI